MCHLCTELNSLDTGKMFYVMEWDHGNKLDSICNTINVQDIKQEISSKLKDDSISCDNLKSIRHKFVNGTSPDLHRVVIHLEQADGTVFDKVFVQYYHDKELHFFNLFLMETVKNVKVIRELLKQRRPTLKV